MLLTDTSANTNPRPPPIKKSSSTQALTRTKRGKHPSPPSLTKGDKIQDHAPLTSPARQSRRPHNNLLRIITEEGEPDRDSTPGPKPYTSLVPPTSPWNTHGKHIIGVHNHSRVAISPTLLSPERYQWLYETHSRLQNQTDLTQNLLGLMSRYHPRAKTLNPQGCTQKLASLWAIPPKLRQAM